MRLNFLRSVSVAFLALIFITIAIPVSAQEAAVSDIDQQYLQMLEQAKSMPENYDFAAVRAIYPKTSFFNPYGTFYKKEVHELFGHLKAGQSGAEEVLNTYLRNNFPLPEVHTRYLSNYNTLGKQDLVKFHEWAAKGFMKALFDTGNGVDAARSFDVLNISEEYLIARGYISDQPEQSLRQQDGRIYDVLTGTEKDAGKKIDIWFDITDIWAKNPANEVRSAQ